MTDIKKLLLLMEDAEKKDDSSSKDKKDKEDLSRAAIAGTAEEHAILAHIRRHYPEAPDVQSAFIKFVIHSLEHSYEDSERQEKEISNLKRDIQELQQAISEMGTSVSSDPSQDP